MASQPGGWEAIWDTNGSASLTVIVLISLSCPNLPSGNQDPPNQAVLEDLEQTLWPNLAACAPRHLCSLFLPLPPALPARSDPGNPIPATSPILDTMCHCDTWIMPPRQRGERSDCIKMKQKLKPTH